MNESTKTNPDTVESEGMDYGTYLQKMALKVERGRPSRKLHKELKKHFGKKSGLPLYMRYPNAPLIASLIMLLLSVTSLMMKLLYYT